MDGHEEIVNVLSTFKEEELKGFLHSCMDEMCGRKGPVYENVRLPDQFSFEDFKEAVATAKKLCSDLVSLDLNFDKMINNCERKVLRENFQIKEFIPALSHNQFEVLRDCLTARKNELNAFVTTDQVNKSENILKDYDWKLKWIVGSSSFSDIHEPLLNLDLHLKSGDGNRTLSLELDKAELKTLIEAMEKAQQSMFSR